MKLDDLKQNWQKNIEHHDSAEDIQEMINMLKVETNKIDKELKRRDILEISIALLLIPVWIYGLTISVSLMQSLGCIVAIFTGLFITYRMLQARQVKQSSQGDNLRAYLQIEREKTLKQKQLLESIAWWYILPIVISVVLITLGATVDESGLPQLNDVLTMYYAMLAILVIGIYHLNKRAANKRFAPLLEKIERQLAQLDG